MNKIITLNQVYNTVEEIFHRAMHKKLQKSVGNAIYGTMHATRLSTTSIGRAFASVCSKIPKHAIKQVSRLLGNENLDMHTFMEFYVRWVIGQRKQVVVALDWTEFCFTGYYLLTAEVITRHGRSTPLIWWAVDDRKLRNRRSKFEKDILLRLKSMIPADVELTILADRGFSNTSFYRFIDEVLGWYYVIRFKNNIYIEDLEGEKRKAFEWVPLNGSIRELRDASVTNSNDEMIPAVVFVKKRGMKDAWHLATNLQNQKERVVSLYGRRFTCEENFRDIKDDRYGMGLKETIVTSTERWDRIMLIQAISGVLLTLLGAVGEFLGYSRLLRANTVNYRTHSLYRQGKEYLRGVAETYFRLFKRSFTQLIVRQRSFKNVYGII